MNGLPLLKPETPKEAARRLATGALRDGYEPQALYTYRDADGSPLYWRIRMHHPKTGAKWIRPMHLNDGIFDVGEPKPPLDGKPLYLLPALLTTDPAVPVFIAEGENCADALANLGLVATTSGGATSADGADWQPLRGRQCVVWPDHDKPGTEYARAVIAKLCGIASVSLVADEVVQVLPEH